MFLKPLKSVADSNHAAQPTTLKALVVSSWSANHFKFSKSTLNSVRLRVLFVIFTSFSFKILTVK